MMCYKLHVHVHTLEQLANAQLCSRVSRVLFTGQGDLVRIRTRLRCFAWSKASFPRVLDRCETLILLCHDPEVSPIKLASRLLLGV